MPKPGGKDKTQRGAASLRAREQDRKSVPAAPPPEFSRPANVSRMGRLEHRVEIAANAEERAALARRFGLIELEELSAKLALKKRGDGVVEVSGTFRARLAQPCVVTLDPVPATIEDEVRLFFSGETGDAARARHAIADFDPMDDDGTPDPIVGGSIDLGESVAQLMALALDPYPRSPAASTPG